MERALAGARCECDPRPLLPELLELRDLVDRRNSEIQALQAEAHCVPSASPEIEAMSGENAALMKRARDASARVAVLRTENSALTWAVEADRDRAQELRAERRKLLEKIGVAERHEAAALQACSRSGRELEEERRVTRDRVLGHEGALEAVTERAESAEASWSAAEESVSRLEFAETRAEADAVRESRASLLETQRNRRLIGELEGQLREAEEGDTASGAESLDEDLRRAALGAKLAEVRVHASELRCTESSLASRLAASQRRGEETERKAMSVARELVDSSQAIAWLHAEVASQRSMQRELEETQQRIAGLRQQLHDLHEAQEEAEVEADPACVESAGEHEPVASSGGAVGSTALARGGCGAAEAGSCAEQQLSALRTGQARALNEALREAWEAEARDHRALQRKLQAWEGSLRPVLQQLLRLTEVARLWREDLLRSGSPPERRVSIGDGEGDRGGGSGPLEVALPAPPPEACWEEEPKRPEAARALCLCVEALAAETFRRIGENESCRRAALAAQQSANDSFLLRAERLALERELERLTPAGLHQMPEANASYSVAPSPRLSSSAGTSRGLLPPHDAAGRADPPSPSASSRQVIQQDRNVWPPSPVPRRPRRGPAAGVLAAHGYVAHGGPGPQGSRGCLTSSLSSVSLHDHRTPEPAVSSRAASARSLHQGTPGQPEVPEPEQADGLGQQQEPRAEPRAQRPQHLALQRSEEPRRSARSSEAPERPRYLQLQRPAGPASVPGSAGPLYRLDRGARPGATSETPPAPHRGRGGSASNAGGTPARRTAGRRQIPVRRKLDDLLDDPSDRFDPYSVHRPGSGVGLL
uniref:Uncharacterized protein n=1 Tax=Alexandrium monilatum TaxID=311494 RepID=A0A7S4Q5S8_9DINO